MPQVCTANTAPFEAVESDGPAARMTASSADVAAWLMGGGLEHAQPVMSPADYVMSLQPDEVLAEEQKVVDRCKESFKLLQSMQGSWTVTVEVSGTQVVRKHNGVLVRCLLATCATSRLKRLAGNAGCCAAACCT